MASWLDELEMAGVRMASELGEVVLCPEGFARLIAAAKWAEARIEFFVAQGKFYKGLIGQDEYDQALGAEGHAQLDYFKATGRWP